MTPRISSTKEPKYLFLFALIAFLELMIAGVVTLLIAPDPRNAIFLGFSLQRLVLTAGIFLLAILALVAGVMANRIKIPFDTIWLIGRKALLRRVVYGISFLLIIWGWTSLFTPAYLFGKLTYFYQRLQPLSIAIGLVAAQFWLLYLYARGRLAFGGPLKAALQKYYRPTVVFAIVMIALGIFIAATKFGLVGDLSFWNVPGIPLSSMQLALLLLLLGVLILFWPTPEGENPIWKGVRQYRLIPICIYLTAVLVWGLTPMLKQFFSLQPLPPNFQPYPYSDARVHDLGGISVMKGYGIYFHGYTDKPLYMVILGILHSIAGYDYVLMTWLQILILALIPVVLFRLGEKFHSIPFGILLAGILILRQRNAIVLSYQISSVNPRLLVTEEMTFLGVVLTTYLLFQWARSPKNWLALLCGACIGAASLIRLNPLFLFPTAAGLIVVVLWKSGKKILFGQLAIYTIGFLLLFLPWVVTGVNPEGRPWLLIKLQDVIHSRYGYVAPAPQDVSALDPFPGGMVSEDMESFAGHEKIGLALKSSELALLDGNSDSEGMAYRFFDHLLHNFSTSLLSMPDALFYDDVSTLGQRIYWSDSNVWDGNLPPIQTTLVFFNIVLIAIGLGYSWVRYRWAGMAPLVVYLAYALSLSSAMNSGGRYLVPMDWVFYFYYALALVVILKFILGIMSGKSLQPASLLESQESGAASERRLLGLAFAGVIVLASLIPVANLLVPAIMGDATTPADVEAVRQRIMAQENTDVLYGEVLYPYSYNDTTMFFELMMPGGYETYTLTSDPDSSVDLTDGEHVFVAYHIDSENAPQAEAIYLWQDAQAQLIWESQP